MPDVGDVGGAARQHAGVGGGDVGVGADDRGDAAVEVPAHRHLLARHLGVEVDEEGVGLAFQAVEDGVDLGERRAGGLELHLAAKVDHRHPACRRPPTTV